MQISLTDEVTRRRWTPGLAIRGGLVLAVALLAVSAQAAYTVTVYESGTDVIASGSGSLKLTAWTKPDGTNAQRASTYPIGGYLQTGPISFTATDYYLGIQAAPNQSSGLGNGGVVIQATSGTGASVGISGAGGMLSVPTGYVSESQLTSSATWANQTIAGLAMEPGTYVWTWGNGGTADSFTVIIQGAAAPVAANDSYTTQINHGLSVGTPGVLGNDTPSSGLTVSNWGTPGHGTLTSAAADGSFQYTPNTGWYGTDTFTYTATDGSQTSSATVSIVIPQGTPPAITSGALPDGTVGIGYGFTVTASGSPAPTFSDNGTLPPGLQIDAVGAITGFPQQAGTYNVQITASNGALPNATADYTVTITPAAAAPAVTSVPTLSQWAQILLGLLLAAGALLGIQRGERQ